MSFLWYLFILFFTAQFTETKENNLWKQVLPLIQKTDSSKFPTPQEILYSCARQAIILNKSSKKPLDTETLQTLQSLHIFSEILPKIARNNLTWGYFELAQNICQISDNQEILNDRNLFFHYLRNNKHVVDNLNEILINLKEAESDFLLNFYFKFTKKEKNNPSGPIEEGFSYLEELEKKILSNRYSGGLYKLTKQGQVILSICASLSSVYYFEQFKEHNRSNLSWSLEKSLSVMHTALWGIPQMIWDLPDLFSAQNLANNTASSITAPCSILASIATIVGVVLMSKSLKSDFDLAIQKQKSLFLFKDLLKSCKKLKKIIQNDAALKNFLPEYMIIKKFAEHKKHPEYLSTQMNHFLSLLDYYPFNQNEPSSYPLWQGKIYETFLIYEELKDEIVPLWQALGKLDAYLSVYSLLAAHPNDFCLPEWLENIRPVLEIEGYWHPMISLSKAVKNNIKLGNDGIACNSIITGANAGGKTTAMTAMMLCAVLAQSLGIAPARSYQATPFTRIHTYLDITTNLTTNESLFVAQANRAKNLFESIKSCSNNEKSLTILDEIFTGTRADFAEKASYEFAQKLGNFPNSICIIATHFPKLTELEQNSLFINYQAAPAVVDRDGTLNYPYLIIPGISEQNVADIILKNKGILD